MLREPCGVRNPTRISHMQSMCLHHCTKAPAPKFLILQKLGNIKTLNCDKVAAWVISSAGMSCLLRAKMWKEQRATLWERWCLMKRSKQSLWPLPLVVNLVPSSTPVTHCGSPAYLCCYHCQVCGEPQRKTSDVAEIKCCHQAALWFPWWHQGKRLPGKMQCGRFWKQALFSGQDLRVGRTGAIVQ